MSNASLDRKIYDFFRRKTLSDIKSMELIGKARIGLEQGAGVLLDGTGEWDDQYALRIHASVVEADVPAYPYAGIYATMTFAEDQDKGLSGFGIWSELYLNTGVDLTGASNFAAVWGNVCVDGTVVSSNGLLACLWGAMNLPAGFTNMGRLAGISLDSEIAAGASLIASSAKAAAVLVSKGVDNKLPWPYGFYVMDSAALVGIKVGDSQGAGIILTGANGFYYDQACQIHASITSASRPASAYAGIYGTMSISAAQTLDLSAFAIWGELWINNVSLAGASNFASLWGNVIMSGTVTSSSGWIAGVLSVLNGPATGFTNNGLMAGFAADCELRTNTTNNGTIAAFYATKGADSNKMAWPMGIYIPSGAATKLFDMTCALTGIVGIDGAKLAFTAGTTSSALVPHGGGEGLYIYQDITGTKTGNARTEAMSIVQTLSGSGASDTIYGLHVHFHNGGMNPGAGANLFGIVADLDNPGSSCGNCIAIDAYRDGANSPTTRDACIRLANGGSAVIHEALLIEGVFYNLFEIQLQGQSCLVAAAPGGSVTHKIRISIPNIVGQAEVEAWIPVYTG